MQNNLKLFVAFDFSSLNNAKEFSKKLNPQQCGIKVGKELFTLGGPAIVEWIQSKGFKVFLDMKFFDIGATVEKAVAGISQYNFDFLTVHGDPHVVRAAVAGRGNSCTKILAVTILTSLDREDLDDALIKDGNLSDLVIERAQNAFKAGADGIIASPQEAALIRPLPEAVGKLIITPGVRPLGSVLDDQKRVTTPAEAIKNGADHIVIGRPIWDSKNPRNAALKILNEIKIV